MNMQRRLLPKKVHLLSLHPIQTIFRNLHIEIVDDASQNQAHLGVRKAILHRFVRRASCTVEGGGLMLTFVLGSCEDPRGRAVECQSCRWSTAHRRENAPGGIRRGRQSASRCGMWPSGGLRRPSVNEVRYCGFLFSMSLNENRGSR